MNTETGDSSTEKVSPSVLAGLVAGAARFDLQLVRRQTHMMEWEVHLEVGFDIPCTELRELVRRQLGMGAVRDERLLICDPKLQQLFLSVFSGLSCCPSSLQ